MKKGRMGILILAISLTLAVQIAHAVQADSSTGGHGDRDASTAIPRATPAGTPAQQAPPTAENGAASLQPVLGALCRQYRRPAPPPRPLRVMMQATDPEQETQLMILGTMHLRVLKDNFHPEILDSLLTVLESYHPDIVGVESMPAWLIAEMEEQKGVYGPVLDFFAKDRLEFGHEAQHALGITRAAAQQAASAQLRGSPDGQFSDAQRRKLVLQMLAAYDINSALLQWSYLPEAEQKGSAEFPAEIASFLDSELKKADEKSAIGVVLAHRLHLQTIAAIDDDKEGTELEGISSDLGKAMRSNPALLEAVHAPLYGESSWLLAADNREKRDILPFYLELNSPEYADADVATQWGVFLRSHLPSGADRKRLGLWELRNLNIASHIRQETAMMPGKRMLVIIGAAHKPFLDNYLREMTDLRIVNLSDEVCQQASQHP